MKILFHFLKGNYGEMYKWHECEPLPLSVSVCQDVRTLKSPKRPISVKLGIKAQLNNVGKIEIVLYLYPRH